MARYIKNAGKTRKGQKKKKRTTVFLCVLFVLLFSLAIAYASLQNHIIYSAEGIRFDFSNEEQASVPVRHFEYDDGGETAAAFDPKASPSVSVDSNGLPPYGAPPADTLYIDVSAMSLQALADKPAELVKENIKRVIIDVKNPAGRLNYDSETEFTESIKALDMSGGALEAFISDCNTRGVRVCGRVCCFCDSTLPQKEKDCALYTTGKRLFVDDNGHAWLDPENEKVREYIKDICLEAKTLGLREIVLDDFAYPVPNGETTLKTGGAHMETLSSLLESIREELGDDVYLSAVTYADVWGEGASEARGQSLDRLLALCDRVYIRCEDEIEARQYYTEASSMPAFAADKLAFIQGGRYVSASILLG